MTYLLDTNIISEVRKEQGNPRVKDWFATTQSNQLYLSVLTLGEIRHGIERLHRRHFSQSSVFESWLAALERDFVDRFLPVTGEIADVWGRMGAPGHQVSLIDGLLAATAHVHGLILVTRNTNDLVGTGARLLNPLRDLLHR